MTSLIDVSFNVSDACELSNDQSLTESMSESPKSENTVQRKEIRYDRKTLLEISQSADIDLYKAQFLERIRESEHNAYTMYLLLKKDSEADSYVENNQRSFFDNRYKSNNGTNRIEQKGDSSRDNSYKYEKSYRQPKPYENDNVNWRSEVNNRNKQQSNRYNSNRRYDRYSRNNRYDDYEEDEPEWFSNGPISMHDIIDLGGFEEDDENYNSKKKEENFSSNSSDVDNSVNNSIKNNSNALELSLLDSSFFNLTNASSDSQDINDISLKIFDQLNSSSTSSRAGKWFKSNKDADANADGSFHNKHSANQNSSIMDLFQNKNIDLSKLPRPPVPNMKSELSKAVSVAELEASIFNSPNNKSANISRDSQPDMLSMLFASSLNQEPKPNNPSKPSLNDTNSSTPNSNSDVLVEPSLSNNLQNISELNKMLYSSIHKMNPPPSSKPFTAVNNSIPFNFEQLHQKQHLQFPYPYYPGVSPHFIPNNPSRHPNIMPNYALLSNFPNNSAPPQHIPPQFMLNHTMSSTSVANKPCINASNDVNRPKQDNSITNKLLKNMKFTPTSVFRKLKEHDPTKAKQSSKPECESVTKLFDDDKSLNNSLETLFASVKSQSNSSETSKPPGLDDSSKSEDIGHLLKKMNLNLNSPQAKTISPNKTEAPKIVPELSAGLNANNLLNAMQQSESNNVLGFPLPLKNALKLEDVEKLYV